MLESLLEQQRTISCYTVLHQKEKAGSYIISAAELIGGDLLTLKFRQQRTRQDRQKMQRIYHNVACCVIYLAHLARYSVLDAFLFLGLPLGWLTLLLYLEPEERCTFYNST